MDPLTVTEAEFTRLILPPDAKIAGPANVKNVTISPGPNVLRMVVIGVEEGFRPMV